MAPSDREGSSTSRPTGLQLRQVRVQVQAVETANGQRHVVANKLMDVGHRRLLWRGNRPMLLHAEYADVTDVGANAFIPSEAAPQTGGGVLHSTV